MRSHRRTGPSARAVVGTAVLVLAWLPVAWAAPQEWALLVPPLASGKHWSDAPQAHLETPVQSWHRERTFASEADCRAWRDAQLHALTGQMDQTMTDMQPDSPHTREIQASLRKRYQASALAYEHALCLASDDPRLGAPR